MKIRNNNKKEALPKATTPTHTHSPTHTHTQAHSHTGICVCVLPRDMAMANRINQKYAAQIGQSKVTKTLWQPQ